MHLMYFTEQPMSTYPEEEGKKFGYTANLFSNRFYDAKEGSRLYNERIDEYIYAEECGVDGIMLNEHHNAPFCMQPRIEICAAILAAVTKRVKIVLLGVPLPTRDDPVGVAEQMSMIDMISKGRLVPGIVRGSGNEQFATNVNPAFNRERFEEAHDLMIKAYTTPGPFRWAGNHYKFRVVNPWALPLQKPHPRIWVPGVLSMETVVWAAKHRYPYICLNTTIEATQHIWKTYDEAAREVGYEAGPENRGYLIRCHVQDTDEKAQENGRQFMWMQGEFTGLSHPVWGNPSGYLSPLNRRRILEARGVRRPYTPYEKQLDQGMIIAGKPETVIKRLKTILDAARPSILAIWGNDGKVSHKDSMNCIRLLGQEVMPAIRDYGKQLGLKDPFEINAPVSLQYTPKEQLKPRPKEATAAA